jgi:hypothetical protein
LNRVHELVRSARPARRIRSIPDGERSQETAATGRAVNDRPVPNQGPAYSGSAVVHNDFRDIAQQLLGFGFRTPKEYRHRHDSPRKMQADAPAKSEMPMAG